MLTINNPLYVDGIRKNPYIGVAICSVDFNKLLSAVDTMSDSRSRHRDFNPPYFRSRLNMK